MFLFRKGWYFQKSDDPPSGPPADSPAAPPANGNKPPESWDEVFQHPRFKELNDKKKAAEDELARIAANKAKADEDALKEQNKWKELYEAETTKHKETQVGLLRLKTLTSKILPDDSKDLLSLIDRLKGDTEEEIAKDADGLLALMVKPAGKGLPRSRGGSGPGEIDFSKETDPAKIREAARKMQSQSES